MKRNIYFFLLLFLMSCTSVDKKQKSITCYFFFNSDCPAAQKYIYIMNELYRSFDSDTLEFIGVCTNYDRHLYNTTDVGEKIGLDFKVVIDKKFELCRKFNVHVSPQVVLCNFNDQILYTGSIDDYYFDVGLHKSRVNKNYLKDALKARVSNEDIKIKKTEAYGCILNY